MNSVKPVGHSACALPSQLTDLYLCVMLAVFPLWCGGGGYTEITDAKFRFFFWATVLYLALLLLLLLELRVVQGIRLFETVPKSRHSSTWICLCIYFVFCCCSALWSNYDIQTFWGLGRYEGLTTTALYLGLWWSVSRFGQFRVKYLYLLGGVVLCNAVLGIVQYAGYNPFALFPQDYNYHDAFVFYANEFLGTLGNVDFLSGFLALVLPIFFAYYVTKESARSRLTLLPLGAGAFLLFLSGVSAGVVGLGAAVLLTLPFLLTSRVRCARWCVGASVLTLALVLARGLTASYENRVTALSFTFSALTPILLVGVLALLCLAAVMRKRAAAPFPPPRQLFKGLWVLIAAVVIICVAAVYFIPFSGGTLSELHGVLHGTADPSFGSGRLGIWSETMKLVPEHLLLGGGPDTLAARLTYQFERYNPTLGITIHSVVDNAHNEYLNILVNTGLPSLLAYLAALVFAAVRGLRVSARRPEVILLGGALLAYLVQIFFSFSICAVSPLFWILFAFFEHAVQSNTMEGKGNQT